MSGQDHKGQEPVNPRIFPLPPVVLLLFLAGGYGLQRFFPIGGGSAAIESVIAGNALMVLAFAIAVLAARELARAQTAIRPGKQAAVLVRTGVFARSRNPIYLSFVFFMVGFGLATANPWMIILAPLLVLYVQERIIKREEGYLTQRFGPDYIDLPEEGAALVLTPRLCFFGTVYNIPVDTEIALARLYIVCVRMVPQTRARVF